MIGIVPRSGMQVLVALDAINHPMIRIQIHIPQLETRIISLCNDPTPRIPQRYLVGHDCGVNMA